MDDFSNFDPEDAEFYNSIFVRRLRAVAKSIFEGKNYGDYSPEDLLSDTLERFYVKQPWKRRELQQFKRMFGYMVRVMRNIYLSRLPEHETDSIEVLSEERFASSEGVEKNQKALETKSIAKAMKSYFPGDKQMHTYIDLCYVCDLKRREIAEAMGLEPRDVTDLDRKLRYRIPDSVLLRFIGYPTVG